MIKEKRIIRRKTVQDRTGLPQSTIYSLVAQDLFPKPIKLHKRSVGWLEEDITNWIENKVTSSRNDN